MPPSGEDRRIERGATLLKEQSELGQLESSHGVAESTEEAALNALVAADTVEGRDGNTLCGFPIDRGSAHMTKR